MAFDLQLRKKHGKTSVTVAGECQLAKSIQNRAYLSIRIYKHNNKNNINTTIIHKHDNKYAMNILVFTHYSTYVLHTEEEGELALTKLTWEMALL
jgi:hypothetical protein